MDDLVRFLSFSRRLTFVDAMEKRLESSDNKVVTASSNSSSMQRHNYSEGVTDSDEDLVCGDCCWEKIGTRGGGTDCYGCEGFVDIVLRHCPRLCPIFSKYFLDEEYGLITFSCKIV